MAYSANDILSMQKDAVRRVREMQSRANGHVGSTTTPPPVKSSPPTPPPKPEKPDEVADGGSLDILKSLGIDNERALILLVTILLAREGADQKLILALLYLIM